MAKKDSFVKQNIATNPSFLGKMALIFVQQTLQILNSVTKQFFTRKPNLKINENGATKAINKC